MFFEGGFDFEEAFSKHVLIVVSGYLVSGIAFDGFPIYGPIDETGRQLTTKDLDECHGKVSSNGNYRLVESPMKSILLNSSYSNRDILVLHFAHQV